MAVIKYSDFVQTGQVTVDATSGTVIVFPANFSTTPRIVCTSSTLTTVMTSSASTASFTLTTGVASTVDWIAIYQSL